MKVVKISFKTEEGKYEFFANSEQVMSILADDLFTANFVDPRSGKVINHGAAIESALQITPTEVEESPE